MRDPEKSDPEYQWTKVTGTAAFAPRDGAGALVFKERMWLLGGWNPSDLIHFPKICNSEVWASEDGLKWELIVKAAPWEGRHTAGYLVHADKMWILGGDANQGHYQNDVWNSADGVNWKKVCDTLPWGNRVLHHAISFAGKMWILGGQNMTHMIPESEDIFYSDVWNSEDGIHWRKVADNLPWGPRGMIGGQAVLQNKMWLIGGGTYDTPRKPDRVHYNDVWNSPDGINWTQILSSSPWLARQYHEVAVFDDRIWVLEGYNRQGGNRNDVWYSSDGVQWTEVQNTPWAPRHAASAFVFDSGLWIVAGNNMTSDVWKLIRV
ncbi:hypothetical protein BH09VER1_BH09VER1_51690 [soil metagenome]